MGHTSRFGKTGVVWAQGGAHQHFVCYCLDRFSSLTPEITRLPFTNNGTSHDTSMLSGNFLKVHPSNTKPYFPVKADFHVLVTIDNDDLLFLERIVSFRAGDCKQSFDGDYISFNEKFIKGFPYVEKFENMYGLKINPDTKIPNFLIRDFFKLMFLNTKTNGFIEKQVNHLKNLPENTYLLPLADIWNKENFVKRLQEIDIKFKIGLKIDSQIDDVHHEFLKNIQQFKTKERAKNIVSAIEKKQYMDISEIDLIEQAYISAYLEKNNNFITIPFTKSFFKDTQEIIDFIKWYPEHYKAMNPNLPIFNNIPNPFFLWHNREKK